MSQHPSTVVRDPAAQQNFELLLRRLQAIEARLTAIEGRLTAAGIP